MQKILVMYKLRPGVRLEDYKRWSREVDQKITPFQPGVKSFQVYEIAGGHDANSPYQIVEDIDVENAENYPPKTDAMKRVVDQWEKYCDASSVVTLHGKRIE